MLPTRPRRQGAPARLPHHLELLLDAAAILAAQGSVRLPTYQTIQMILHPYVPAPATAPEWVADYPQEAAALRDTCRAARGDRPLLAQVARMRLGRRGLTLLHRAAYLGDWVAARDALLHHDCLLTLDAARVHVGSVPEYAGAAPLTPLTLALNGAHGRSSKDVVELLLAVGASPDRALEGLISSCHNVTHARAAGFSAALVSRVLALASPAFSPWKAWDVCLMLRRPSLTAAATRRLVEEVPGVLAGEFDDRIEWELQNFNERYGATRHRLLRALAAPLPPRFFCEVLQAYAAAEDTHALAAALGTPLAKDPRNRAVALWTAAVSGLLGCAQDLLHPALQLVSVYGPYSKETTPMAAAAMQGHAEVVEFLVANQTAAQGTYAEKLHAAVRAGLAAQVQRLLQHHRGAIDLEAQMRDYDGMFDDGAPRYALVLACAVGQREIVELLVGAGASLRVGMDSGRDAPLVCWAAGASDYCRRGVPEGARLELLTYLIKAGALYCGAQWEAAAQAGGAAHLVGLDWRWLDECELVQRAVAALGMVWGAAWVA